MTYELANGHMRTVIPARAASTAPSRASSDSLSALAAPLAVPEESPSETATTACTLNEATPTTSSCGGNTVEAGWKEVVNGEGNGVHGLLEFVLPNLGNNAIVLNAKLALYEKAQTTKTKVAMSVYRVLTPWASGATWKTTNGSTPWEKEGGDFEEAGSAIDEDVGEKAGAKTWYPTQMVQRWINGALAPRNEGSENLGLLIKDDPESEGLSNVVTFDGPAAAKKYPTLTIEWVPRGIGASPRYTLLPVASSASTTEKVDPASGDLLATSTDLTIEAKSFPFVVARTYNSLAPSELGYGRGWTDNNTEHLRVEADGSVEYTDPSGATYEFIKNGSSLTTPPELEGEVVICLPGGEITSGGFHCSKELPDGASYAVIYVKTELQYDFSGTEGTLYPLSAETPFAKETANYTTGYTLPTSWTDNANAAIDYEESKTKGYIGVTFPAEEEEVKYVEKKNASSVYKLVEFTSEQGKVTKYVYGTGAQDELLTEIVEASGAVIKITYNSAGQVASVESIAAGQKTGPTTTYTYYEVGKAPSPCSASQKATIATESEGSEESPLIFCVNVLDEVESINHGVSTGQSGWYAFEGEDVDQTEKASVDLASGNLLVSAEDVAPEEATHQLSFMRYYNSQAAAKASTLGSRWSWGTGPAVYLSNKGPFVTLHGPSGYTAFFTQTGETTYAPPEEFLGTLTKSKAGTYTLAMERGVTYQFNAEGTLTSESMPEGGSFAVDDTTLSGENVLHSLTGESGKPLEVTYNSGGKVAEVVDPAGLVHHYAYNTSGELESYTSPSGAKTEYGYASSGYLDKITSPQGTTNITMNGDKVSELTYTSTSGETNGETIGAKFSYQTPTAPACNPATDVYETVITSIPAETTETFCYDALGRYTSPASEAETEEAGITPPEVPAGTCEEDPELGKSDCEYEDGPPEETEDLHSENYGIADDNWLSYYEPTKKQKEEHREAHTPFDIFTHSAFTALKVKWVRRVVPWNMVSEAEHDEEVSEDNPGALQNLEDIEEWIKEVKASGAEPFVSFDDECPAPPPEWANPGKLPQPEHPCSQPPEKHEYEAAVARFLKPSTKHAILGEVSNFTALNEPNNADLNKAGEHVKPTYTSTLTEAEKKEGKKFSGAELAGQYWRALSDLCSKQIREKEGKKACNVSAGEFLDVQMRNPYNAKGEDNGYAYFHAYVHGMGHPLTATRWAWHAYEDGENVITLYHGGSPKKWWSDFHNFEKAVDQVEKHGIDTHPNILLTEQGVLFLYGEHITKSKVWKNPAAAEQEMNAYVKDPNQLTNQGHQISKFFYYSMRGEPGFDSGLLEAERLPGSLKPARKYLENHEREIYRIYKQKTPGG